MGTPDAPGGASEAGRVDDPFDWRVTKAGEVMIGRGGRTVVTLGGPRAARLIRALAGADETAAQQLLARATGNYKRGNERSTGDRSAGGGSGQRT